MTHPESTRKPVSGKPALFGMFAIAAVMAVAVIVNSSSSGTEAASKPQTIVPLDDGFHAPSDMKADVIDAVVFVVRKNGYPCESVSAISRFFLRPGFDITCDKDMDEYYIEHKAGEWVVEPH